MSTKKEHMPDAEAEILFKSDPGLYRRLSEPFPDFATADKSLNAFQADLRALREKHHIRDLHVIISGSSMTEDGQEAEFMLSAHHGDAFRAETMVAYALGREQLGRQERIGVLARQAMQQLKGGK